MDRDRRYGWGHEGRDEDRGGPGSRSRDRDDEWRERGGYLAGGGGRDDEGDREFGMSGQAGRGDQGGGYSSRGWERDRDRFESSRSSGYGQMGMGNQGGWGSSHGLSGYGPQSSQQGSWGSTGYDRGGYGSSGYDQGGYDQGGYGQGSFGRGGHASSGYGQRGRETSRETGPYGASPSWYGGGSSTRTAREWERDRGGWDRDRGGWDRDRDRTGGWEGGEHREGGVLHRMGEGLRSMFGGERGDRGPFFGRGPKGYKRSDERVREEVCEVIAHQGYIDASDVEVRVQNGEVTLSGFVRDREHKRRLEQMIEDVPGVDDVKNEIRVQRMDPSQGVQSRTAGVTSSTTTSSEDNGNRGGRSRTS